MLPQALPGQSAGRLLPQGQAAGAHRGSRLAGQGLTGQARPAAPGKSRAAGGSPSPSPRQWAPQMATGQGQGQGQGGMSAHG